MPDFQFTSGGTPATTVVKQNGENMRHVAAVTFRQSVDEASCVEVEYCGTAFHVESAGAEIKCAGTDLGEAAERAVLAYLKAKYAE